MSRTLQVIKQRFGIIGNAVSLNHALETAIQIAPTELTVLITGESGVGKESFSKIIHNLSNRKHNNFIAINCGALPESTLYSELFGHVKGAFTGANSDRKGYFETVNGGTIFLDEIGEMPMQLQQYLLRVLEQGEYVKMGSNKVETTDVRIIAATNVKLEENIRKGKFREDLYYRLNTVPIKVPPLRDRGEDISILFRKFAADFADKYQTSSVRLDERAQLLLENYQWPGNIRELRNIALQISALASSKLVGAEELLRFLPENALNRNLPALRNNSAHSSALSTAEQNAPGSGQYERELLFKFLYEMRQDLSDVKNLIAELARTNNLRMPTNVPKTTLPSINDTPPPPNLSTKSHLEDFSYNNELTDEDYEITPSNLNTSIIINDTPPTANRLDKFSDVEEIEESLSLEDMERDMIKKALTKHRGRRKEAARELGISERTLYRKIRQYEIDA